MLKRKSINVKRPHIKSNKSSPYNTLCRSVSGSAISVSGHIERGSGSLSRLPSPAFAPPVTARFSKTGISRVLLKYLFEGKFHLEGRMNLGNLNCTKTHGELSHLGSPHITSRTAAWEWAISPVYGKWAGRNRRQIERIYMGHMAASLLCPSFTSTLTREKQKCHINFTLYN